MGRGLKNGGAQCYMNAVLQCLARTSILDGVRAATGVTAQLRATLHDLHTISDTPLSTSALVCALEEKGVSFPQSIQHDAHEFLMALLDAVQTELKSTLVSVDAAAVGPGASAGAATELGKWLGFMRSEGTALGKAMCGMYKDSIRCSKCGREVIKYEPFWVLSLPLAEDIPMALKKFLGDQELADYKCDSCSAVSTCVKSSLITRHPPVLMLHLKRFRVDGSKDTTPIKVPLVILVEGKLYELVGMCNHTGSHASMGHYTADVITFDLKKWETCDDTSVTRSAYTPFADRSDTYILFFVAL